MCTWKFIFFSIIYGLLSISLKFSNLITFNILVFLRRQLLFCAIYTCLEVLDYKFLIDDISEKKNYFHT